MPDSVSEMLRQEMDCESLLECFHGLRDIDEEVFRRLNETDGALTVDEIADSVGRERSTAYRSVQRLLRTGFVRQEQVNYEQGGYYHVYRPRDADEIASEMQRLLNDWYAQMGQLIAEFGDKYGASEQTPAPER